MSKFSKKPKATPEISTASLPDIVFMLLFFFMVSTVMRDQDEIVSVTPPPASQLQKLEKNSVITNIRIGKPKERQFGTEPKVQINDAFVDPKRIPVLIEQERNALPEVDKDKFTVQLRVDQDAKMGIVTDVKEKLREVEARNISYYANKKGAATEE